MRQGIPSLLFYIFPCLIAFSISSEEAEVSYKNDQDASQQKLINNTTNAPKDTTTIVPKELIAKNQPEPKKVATKKKVDLTSIISIDDALFSEHSELEKTNKKYKIQKNKLSNLKDNLKRLTTHAKQLDKELKKSKSALKAAYDKMLTIPDFDISKYQKNYQNIWSDVKQNQQDRLETGQRITEQKSVLKALETKISIFEAKINGLEKNKKLARTERLYEELSEERTEKVSFTNRCSASMTLKQCEDQTIELGLQKTVKQFKKNLLADTTESNVVVPNAKHTSFNVRILKYDVIRSGFQDKNRYQVVLQGLLKSKISKSTSCQLLNLKAQYCAVKKAMKKQQEMAWYNVTIRSNQYDDHVYIDDVSYGKSPVEISLPKGIHTLVVKKDGYVTFRNSFKLHADTNIRAVLSQKGNPLKTGFKFKDSIDKQHSGPEIVAVTPGTYYLGEYSSIQYNLDHAFAISATPVTVAQYKEFVTSTNYKTKAEISKSCLVMKNDQTVSDKNASWKSPGFRQTNENPVVCVTKYDAEAYTRWLTQKTGFTYRLPTEEEWEIASRAGKTTNYWWGDGFLPGAGNTGWGGTYWSNKSTSPVKSFSANAWGIYDVIGNVWEWTNKKQGVTRGGAWCFSPSTAMAFSQLYISPSSSTNYIGFRVLRTIH
ncbi:SUMF1/EgtB/PvdO family nonheme iron enzyme [Vibrio salinus]|uniref:SUMF1/EgtB/PvdO family nonheme iron enzyme n=1 Tax=Vibrio salinus TaxID=2899784 RepID=UPI001E330298|nr:SUMF1/EgtB/PvdO family nonheme iron enzyme [Vibrio salinus]MCE0495122.1 SUMF1/EgtB/PvdO family nonheme iron enzyme [Vibrio salinus]